MRCTLIGLTPAALDRLRVLQCVAPTGALSKSADDDVFNLRVRDRAWRARTRLVQQSIEALIDEPLPPSADGRLRHAQLPRDGV